MNTVCPKKFRRELEMEWGRKESVLGRENDA